jgi:aminopeptidase
MRDMRLNKLAKVLVNYSAQVKKGDFVFVSCEEVAAPWMAEVVREALAAGAHVETCLSSGEVGELKLALSSKEQLLEGSYLFETMLSRADVWLTAWGTRNTRSRSNIDPERQRLAAIGATAWRKIYTDRMGDGTLRWCGTQFPTQADAQEASMSLSEYEDFVYGSGLIDRDDPVAEWQRISREQERWVRYLDSKKRIRIVSEGTDITVNVEGHKWVNCDGRVNFPDGEIFTAPVETDIEGVITFSFPGIYSGKEIEGIRLEVSGGKVTGASAKKGEDLLKALLATDEGASRFGEVAIGTNYGIQRFTRNMLFDEKIGGTVHMAVGDAPKEAGGVNSSSVHWDMLCDMRTGGKIYADGELFYENGRFKDELLD